MSKRHRGKITGESVSFQMPLPAGGVGMETYLPWTLVKRGIRREIITPIDVPQAFAGVRSEQGTADESRSDSALVRALGLAHYWQHLLEQGTVKSIAEIAEKEKLDITYVRRVIRLALLSPLDTQSILTGDEMTFEQAVKKSSNLLWQ